MINDIRLAIKIVGDALGPLRDECVLTGGAMVGFYLSDSQELNIRATEDVDIIINVLTRGEYQDRIDPALRKLGFKQSLLGEDPICRWYVNDITVDIMPIDKSVLGFSNPWYRKGFESAVAVEIFQDYWWKMLAAPIYLATKLTAFLDRGQRDVMSSRDYEDIITLLNGRPELLSEIEAVEVELRSFLIQHARMIIETEEWLEAIPFHLAGDRASQARIDVILTRLEAIASL